MEHAARTWDDLRHALRKERRNSGLIQKEVDREAGFSAGYLAKVECGVLKPSVDALLAILRPLGLGVAIVPLNAPPEED